MRALIVGVSVLVSVGALALEPRGGSKRAKAEASPQAKQLEACQPAAMAEGPIALGFFSADVATGRRACPRTEVGLNLGVDAEIDIPLFRAVLGGGPNLFGSYAVSERLEVFGTFEAVRAVFAQNASLTQTQLGIGQLTAGATYAVWDGPATVLGLSGRLMLPTTTLAVNARPAAVEVGATAMHRVTDRLDAHAFLGLDYTFALTAATSQPRLGLLVGAGAQWTFTDWFGLVLDLTTHLGDRGVFDYFAPALAGRFAFGDRFGVDVGFALQLAGDRSLSMSPGLRVEGLVGIRAAYRF